ncbi:MAG: SDR family NAD(P)-dependent oxidoreductase [Deltaproteobacteria bacterium]|nr:SDR family NAD(P)-dependent oxidoreductase [Deltaproteobacteria bacterium]
MPITMNRRKFIATTSAFAVGAACGGPVLAQTANPGMGPFTKESTAEEVTRGINLTGKTILITGANSGLGYETMRILAMRGAHVIAVARTMQKAVDACATITGTTTPAFCDLSDFASVAACCDTINAMNIPIDVLICNAGIMELPELEKVNGIEKQFVVNHLGHFILTNRLLDRVKQAPQGRVIIMSSGRYKNAPAEGIQFDNLSGDRGYDPLTAYGQSKLANALFAQELSRRLENTATTSNSVLPGVINTNLGRHLPAWKQMLSEVIGWTFMRSVEQGAATTCYVATSPKLAAVSGHMFFNCNPITPEGPHMSDRALATRLWDVSVELTQNYL